MKPTKWMSRFYLFASLVGAVAVGLPGRSAWAGVCWDCRKPAIDMPVSLAVGTVLTPEFPVKHQVYLIKIEARRGRIPFADMNCMMGTSWGPLSSYNCDKEPVLQAEWTVSDGARVVAQGSIHERGG